MPAYEHVHVVGFEETSLVGNVYFTNYLLLQGACRERFLAEHASAVLAPLARREVGFFTHSCACEWRGDWGFEGLDRVLVRMRLARFRGGRMRLEFEYAHERRPTEIVATGSQEVHCKVRRGDEWIPAPFPAPLLRALYAFADTDELRAGLTEALEFLAARPGAPEGPAREAAS